MRYLIIGNGPAGIYAAQKIRQLDKNSELKIFSDEHYSFYSKPRLTTQYLANECEKDKLLLFSPKWYEEQQITVHLNTKVTSLNPGKKEITAQTGLTTTYDKLLLATGSNPAKIPIPGSDSENVFTIRTINDADTIKNIIQTKQSCAVIGGGLLGLEIAHALKKHHISVCVLECFDRLLPKQLDAEGSHILQNLLEEKGLEFSLGVCASAILEKEGKKILVVKEKEATADLVVMATGISPQVELAKPAGIQTNKGVVVNDYLQTNLSDIYAAGDCAEHQDRIYGLWSASLEQGEIAAQNMAGQKTAYTGTTVATMLKVAEIELASLGCVDLREHPQAYEIKKADSNVYQKLFVENDCIIGAIFINDMKKVQKIKKMIKNKIKIDNLKQVWEG